MKAPSKTSFHKAQQSQIQETPSKQDSPIPYRIVCYKINKIYTSTLSHCFQSLYLIPRRTNRFNKYLETSISRVFIRQVFQLKADAYFMIKNLALQRQSQQIVDRVTKINEAKIVGMKIIKSVVKINKLASLIHFITELRQFQLIKRTKYSSNIRKGVKKVDKYLHKQFNYCFLKIRNSTSGFLISINTKQLMRPIIKKYINALSWAILRVKSQIKIAKSQKIKGKVQQYEKKIDNNDEQIKFFQQKLQEMVSSIQKTKEEKIQIQKKYDEQKSKVQNKGQQKIKLMEKQKNSQIELRNKIQQVREKIYASYKQQEIYAMCYRNFIFCVFQNPENNKTKEQLKKSLTIPFLPLFSRRDKLKEQNEVYHNLICEYIMMYGQIKNNNLKQQINLTYLLDEKKYLYNCLNAFLRTKLGFKDDMRLIQQKYECIAAKAKETIKISNY